MSVCVRTQLLCMRVSTVRACAYDVRCQNWQFTSDARKKVAAAGPVQYVEGAAVATSPSLQYSNNYAVGGAAGYSYGGGMSHCPMLQASLNADPILLHWRFCCLLILLFVACVCLELAIGLCKI